MGSATLVLLGSLATGAAAAVAKPAPPPPAASFVSTRTAVVVTELGAQEITVGTTSTLTVTGRLVEGETLTYPLAGLALAVEVTGDGEEMRRCNTVTSDQGRFSCTFHTGAHRMSSAAVRFAGNALFAPAEATTSIADRPTTSPSPAASATQTADPAPSTGPSTTATPTATSPTSPASPASPMQSQQPAPAATPPASLPAGPSGASMP
ncbi:hypothetical protein ACN2WE_35120 [Streptomyces sp. cg28]|uniref:hypothetical protein n=1 Tax=Streptomyces sp. cg28 TaxID=3403457 RepID=UPI003B22068D